jgi:DNA repair protein RecN (Recombination protein N)
MLTELSVRNLGTVKDAKLEFKPGLSVITGETGAGKSMLLTGLRLLMGGRADSKMVRVGEARADVSGVWAITDTDVRQELESHSVAFEDSELYISRYVQDDGKSRLMLGGSYVPTSSMGNISGNLVEIHGQSDQIKLKDPSVQRYILDTYGAGALAKASQKYAKAFTALKQTKAKLKDLQENSTKREIELRYNQDLSQRFDELAPEEDELETLEAEIEKIAHLEDIADGLRETLTLVIPEEIDSPVSLLSQAISTLSKLSKYDAKLSEIANTIDAGLSALEPGLQELEDYANNIDLESLQKLHELEDRLRDLKIFAKPFGGDINRAIEESLKAQEAIAQGEEELDLDELREELKELEANAVAAAALLTKERTKAALGLSKAVNIELAGLAMRGTEFVVDLQPAKLNADGADEIGFMVETQGKNRRPITKAASGGELSRIMLALEVVTASSEIHGTFIFDEVDSGVGGATAIEIGRRLAQLSKLHQVIVVTHLPQVAAFGDSHFVVSKDAESDSVLTSVCEVQAATRIKEVARMLSGLDSTDSGLAHADELLKTAEAAKAAF